MLWSMMMLAATLSVSEPSKDKRFFPYEGLDAVKAGRGGTRVEVDGISIWTTGEPPCTYRVLGQIVDKRAGMLSGNVLNSKAFARRIRNAGGDGAIVVDEQRRSIGGLATGGAWAYAPEKVTKMLVTRCEGPAS